MSKEYTKAELKEACLDWGRYIYTCHAQETSLVKFNVWLDKWWAERNKPVKKIIDLIPLLESGIDCEFSDKDHTHVDAMGALGAIDHRVSPNEHPYINGVDGTAYRYCRPRMYHKMCWNGSKPIEGFFVRAYFDRTTAGPCSTTDKNIHWPHVKAIEFLAVQDGYAYPWEQEE